MYKAITTHELKNLIESNDIKIIDVREPFEHKTGHVPGAKNIPVNTLIQGPTKHLNKDEPFYLICQSGSRSQLACQILVRQGYDVINVNGGHGSYPGPLTK